MLQRDTPFFSEFGERCPHLDLPQISGLRSHHTQNDAQLPLEVLFSDMDMPRQGARRVTEGPPSGDIYHAFDVVVRILVPNQRESQFNQIRRENR